MAMEELAKRRISPSPAKVLKMLPKYIRAEAERDQQFKDDTFTVK
jgi:hypothetical protein